jgi:transglutaminase-like putative cysteine protease
MEELPNGAMRVTVVRESPFRALGWPTAIAVPDGATLPPFVSEPEVRSRAQAWAAGATSVRDVVVQLTDAMSRVVTAARVTGPSSPGETLARGTGDCTEQASLLVALLRSLNIPARVVVGVAAVDDAWRPHAWVEYADETRMPDEQGTTWRTADPSFGAVPASVDRIRLAVGLDAFAALANAGSLTIVVEEGTSMPVRTP